MYIEPFITSAIVVGASALAIFQLSLLLRDNGIMDVFYGLVFVLATWIMYILHAGGSWGQALVLLLVTLWGVRLSLRIYIKHRHRPEDWRYHAWREEWSAKGVGYFLIRSFLQIYVLQGFIIWLVLLPVTLVMTEPALIVTSPFVVLGTLFWIVGFFFEVVADWQLDRFLKDDSNKGSIMTQGLFKYSRRPNYFGESLMWWGLGIVALGVPFGWLGLIGPVVITYVVILITGPMLEDLWKDNEAYQEYARRTSYFIPARPRSVLTE